MMSTLYRRPMNSSFGDVGDPTKTDPIPHPPYRAKPGKLFVGGLSRATTNETLMNYFQQFGTLRECVLMKDTSTNVPRGFGFVTFLDPANADKVLSIKAHYLDGKKIDPQRAIPNSSPARSVNYTYKKLFVGGISQHTTLESLKNYFSRFGEIEDIDLKIDHERKQHRGFAFIAYFSPEVASRVAKIRYHPVDGKVVEAKQAEPKDKIKPPTNSLFQLFYSFLTSKPTF